ncbi:MAG: S-layer homology domain-containing protein [Clostridia bacterium]|nr:S-layer homology domain-containing protein [Clostridia bacterium]
MKKIISTVLALVMAFSAIICGASVSATGDVSSADIFKDVKNDSWFKPSVDYVYNHGLMNGTSATKFEPDTKMSRAMLVTVLWRYEGSPMGYANGFRDIPAGEWYTDAVSWARENGIAAGVSATLFDPDGNVTREQLTTFMYRYTQYMGCDVSAAQSASKFPDGSKVSDWAKQGMEWSIAVGVISGTKDAWGKTVLAPGDNATRAEVATVLMRYCSNPLFIHAWDEGTKISEPTCTERGETVYKCADCGIEKRVAVSPLGHAKTNQSTAKAATCTENGTLSFYCTRCGQWLTEPIEKLGHTWKAATCTAPKTCSRCGATDGAALGHTDTPKCSRCGRNNRAVLISCLRNDIVNKYDGEMVFYEDDSSYFGLWISTDDQLVYESAVGDSTYAVVFQMTVEDKDTLRYVDYLTNDSGQYGIIGNYNIKLSSITKNTQKLNFSDIFYVYDSEDIEAFKSHAATSVKGALEMLNSYMKYNYGFSVHALGYTNYN